jgi:hypothetical protein
MYRWRRSRRWSRSPTAWPGLRASLGFAMQAMTLPANWDDYPNHRHVASVEDTNQEEEVYITLEGSRRSSQTTSASSYGRA